MGVVASSGVNGGFNLRNTGDLIVGTVDGVAGISATSGGSLVIAAAGSLTINEGLLGSNVALSTVDSATAGQNLIVDAGGNIFSLSNSLILSAGDNLTIAAQLGMSGSAAIKLIADSGAADIVGSTIDLTGATFTTANAVTDHGRYGGGYFQYRPVRGQRAQHRRRFADRFAGRHPQHRVAPFEWDPRTDRRRRRYILVHRPGRRRVHYLSYNGSITVGA